MHRLIGAGGLLLAGAGIMTVLLWSPLGAAADGTDRGSPAGGAPGHPFPSSPIVYQQEQTGFTDVDPDSTHAANIDAIAAAGITQGCATDPLRYCPDRPVTRAQTATFLTRALDLPAPDQPAGFADVDPDSTHAANIDAIAAAGITQSCATDPLRYCPDRPVTRAQTATFLTRALDLPAPDQPAGFADVDPDSTHAANIDAIAAAGITQGCATDPLRYCPDRPVTRAQMATFLTRALDLPAPDQPAGISDEVPQAPSISAPIEPAPSSNEAADAEEQPANEGTSTEKQSANQAADTDGQAPTQAKAPPATGFKAVSAGWEHTCGVRTDTTITCWGYNHSGLGEPPAVAGFEDVSAGVGHTCGIRTDRSIVCWGNNYGGQANPPAGAFSAVSVGQGHSCGVRVGGDIACWGSNDDGRADAPSGAFSAVSAGDDHSCGVRVGGDIACWGSNDDGKADPPTGATAMWTPGTTRVADCGLTGPSPAGAPTGTASRTCPREHTARSLSAGGRRAD